MNTRATPKEEILRLLRGKGPMTAAEVAKETGTVVSAARQHLGLLRSDGLVEAEVLRNGVGRPSHRFGLTAAADAEFPKDYEALATALITDLVERGESEVMNNVFESREIELVAAIRPQLKGLSFEEKVKRIAELMSERGYMTDVRVREDGYELSARNCPISAVTKFTSVPCRFELQVFESLLGVRVTRTGSMAQGEPACVYQIPRRQAV
ncbi:MAG: ArsR family transcriptional regulator [Chloroflexota bacterium]|nr:ArsR family transcriptional regulator [Chloroflexota bacterium]